MTGKLDFHLYQFGCGRHLNDIGDYWRVWYHYRLRDFFFNFAKTQIEGELRMVNLGLSGRTGRPAQKSNSPFPRNTIIWRPKAVLAGQYQSLSNGRSTMSLWPSPAGKPAPQSWILDWNTCWDTQPVEYKDLGITYVTIPPSLWMAQMTTG